jgi:hypothetical protein
MKKLIVARYNENLDWLNKINFESVIYNKGDIDSNYINLPNIGREADTYLNYILSNYNNLSDITVFTQANPFDHCYDFVEKVNTTTDFNNVVWLGTNWGPVTKNFEGGPGERPLPLLDICEELFQIKFSKDKTFIFSAGAQYMVPKNFILKKSLNWWKNCYIVFNKYIETSPWAYERIWPLIWNYENL